MKTRFSPVAAQDLIEIFRKLRFESPAAAIGFRGRLNKVRRFLTEYPLAGRKTDDPLVRYVNTIPYPYLVFYELVGDDLVIMRVMHGAQDPDSMPGAPPGP